MAKATTDGLVVRVEMERREAELVVDAAEREIFRWAAGSGYRSASCCSIATQTLSAIRAALAFADQREREAKP